MEIIVKESKERKESTCDIVIGGMPRLKASRGRRGSIAGPKC